MLLLNMRTYLRRSKVSRYSLNIKRIILIYYFNIINATFRQKLIQHAVLLIVK